jgi:hypothetical protein
MSLFRDRENLLAQIVDTEKMLEMLAGHPLMSESIKAKLDNLYTKLKTIPEGIFEPKISLLFSGGAVSGSIGLKSSFISKALLPFQEMIKTQASLVRFGEVGNRGQAKRGANAEMFITSLPVGSFGVELSQLSANDLFAEYEVSRALKQVITLVKNAAVSDEAFETAIINTPKRNLTNLKKFYKEVAEERSFLEMESGDTGVVITEDEVQTAYHRIAATEDEEEQSVINGILRGILLDSGKFEIQDSEGNKISGFISQDLTEDTLIEYDKLYLNQNCKIFLQRHKTRFVTGNEKVDYELLEILG